MGGGTIHISQRDRHPAPTSISEVLKARVPTLKHVPGTVRPRVQQVFASSLTRLHQHKDLLALWEVLAFPKLVLRGTGDPRSHPTMDAGKIVDRRLTLWESGNLAGLWEEVVREAAHLDGTRRPPRSGGVSAHAPRKDGLLVDKMRALISDGAPRKALNLLLSDGLHSATDPAIMMKLAELHPHGNPVITQALPGSVDTGLPSPAAIEEWLPAVLKGVADFPRGSAAGPSGLRPSCLYDLLKRGPHVSTLTRALAVFVADCAHGLLPLNLSAFLGAAYLIPLRKPDRGFAR